MHIPDYLIIEDIQRREKNQQQWEPEPLYLPLDMPRNHREHEEDEEVEEAPRVIIIQM